MMRMLAVLVLLGVTGVAGAMIAKKLLGRRSVVFTVFFVLAAIAAGIAILVHAARPKTDIESAVVRANQLVATVGGPAKVCDEANQMFKRFGVSKQKFLTTAELRDYPAIAALGRWPVIFPGSPPYISIRVGTHIDGFCFVIPDTDSPGKYPRDNRTVELRDSCVFVQR